jgi:hypothetical protein
MLQRNVDVRFCFGLKAQGALAPREQEIKYDDDGDDEGRATGAGGW